MLEHAATFWEAISVEVIFSLVSERKVSAKYVIIWQIFHATDNETEECALKAVKVMLATLYPDTEDADNANLPQDKASNIYTKLTGACLLELKDADKTNAASATKILCQAIPASGELY